MAVWKWETPSAGIWTDAARGESPAAFDQRSIPVDGVARWSNTTGVMEGILSGHWAQERTEAQSATESH